MNASQFSLDYLSPTQSAASAPAEPDQRTRPAAAPATDPWDEVVQFYGAPVLATLQVGGRKRVRELFDVTREQAKAPKLTLDEFARVIHEMVRRRQVAVIEKTPEPADWLVALPLPS